MSGKISIMYSTDEKFLFIYIGNIKKSHDRLYTTAATKKTRRSKMPYMMSSRSVTDGASLS